MESRVVLGINDMFKALLDKSNEVEELTCLEQEFVSKQDEFLMCNIWMVYCRGRQPISRWRST